MSWHRHVRRAGRHLWRVLLLVLLLAVVLAGIVLAVLGSESGSRWLLEQGVGMQKTLSARYEGGTWLTGLELADVRIQTRKTDVRIRHLMARWTVWQLLRGTFQVDTLRLQGVDLTKRAPPTDEPTTLPTLVLPVRLFIRDGVATDIHYWRWQASEPLTLRRLALQDARWIATRVRFRQLVADQDRIGRLALSGWIRLRGGYPLGARGTLDYRPFREQGWGPVGVVLSRSVDELAVRLESQGALAAIAQGQLRPLQHDLPYVATLQWERVSLPWWSDQSWRSEGGRLSVSGNRDGLRGEGSAQLSSRQLPPGQYAVAGRTDWRTANISSFEFKGLGGSLQARAELDWREGLKWQVDSRLTRIDLSRQWLVSLVVVPVLSGRLQSTGHTKGGASDIVADLQLEGGERWEVVQHGRHWPWRLESPQRIWLRWANVERRLPDGRRLVSVAGTAEGEGARDAYRATGRLQLDGDRLPAGEWTLSLAGGGRRVGAAQVGYAGSAGALDFRGTVDLAGPPAWRGTLDLQAFDTTWLQPEWPGQLTGQVTGAGEWAPGRRTFALEDVQLEGHLRGEPFRLAGPLDMTLVPGAWPALRSNSLDVRWGVNHAVFLGGLRDGHWDLAAQLDLGDLALVHAELRGRLAGQVALQGPERRPDLQAQLAGEGTGFRGWRAATVSLQAAVTAFGDNDSRIVVAAGNMRNPAGLALGTAHLEATGRRDRHALAWRAERGDLAGQGQLSGSWSEAGWTGRMETAQVSVADLHWGLEAPAGLDWDRGRREARIGRHCWVSAEARLCNQDEMRLGPSGHVLLSLDGLRLGRLAAFMPEGLAASGVATGRVAGDWAEGEHPRLNAGLEAAGGALTLLREDARSSLVLGFDRIALAAVADPRAVDLRFDLQSAAMGQGVVDARIDPFAAGRPVQGTLSLRDVRLEVFQPFFPALSTLAGTLSAEGRLAGNLARPDFHGTLQLDDGEVGFQRLPLHIRDLRTRVEVRGTAADITGSMRGGDGQATLKGKADWSVEPWLDLALEGERFQLRQPPELLAEVNPDLRLRVVPGSARLTGTVAVPMARLNLRPLTDQAVPLSPDIRITSDADSEQVAVVGRVADWDINADIRLVLGDDVFFHGYGVNGRVMGGLRLRQEGRRGLEANGEVELDKESRYDAYGQRLEIRRGRLIFAGNLSQPGLDVEAVREVDNKVVGVKVQGRANAPEATLFSDTPMSQEEIVSYLVLGRPLDTAARETGSGGNLAAAAAAIKLGATGGAGLTSRVGETFGITDFAVDAEGSGDDTQFTVSGYLSPKLYLRYGVGIFTPVNTATLRYKINSRLYLEAVSSLESAIDLFYNWRF